MRTYTSLLLIAVLILSMTTAAMGAAPRRLIREETLYRAGQQWGPPTNWNPFSTNAAWPTNADLTLYETLFAYSLVSGGLEPILGESYEWVNATTVRLTLQPNTHWQDGTPLTTADVIYTFGLGKKYAVTFSPLWDFITEAKEVDDRTIELTLNPENPNRGMVENYLGTIKIVPMHIWTEIEQRDETVTQAENKQPVGSGPYKLIYGDPQQIIIERDDNYWGIPIYGKPAPKYIVHPIFKSADPGNLALERGQVDFSQQFAPEIWKMWEDKDLPVGTWYSEQPYHMPASIPSLFINVNRYPLSIPEVRRALAYSIDYAKIAETAMSRYSIPVKSSLLIPDAAAEKQYYNEADVAKYGWEYNPEKAKDILENDLGATKGKDGIYVLPDGTRLGPFTAECPYGWTDWMTSLELASANARAVGIDVVTKFPDSPVWSEHRDCGDFDLLMNTPAGGLSPAHPWIRFRDVMDSRSVPGIGEGTAYWNWNRYHNDRVAELLDTAAVSSDEAVLTEVYQELNRIFMQDVPMIPLEYRPWEFYEFNETVWTGFPTADNPTAPPQHNYAGVRVLFQIRPAKQ